MSYRFKPASKPSKREVAIALNSMRHLAPDDKAVELLPVRAARTYDPSAGSEHKEQVKVVAWWDGTRTRPGAAFQYGLPTFALYAVPNAARRGPQLGAWMKAEGLRSGIPDLQLDVSRQGFHGLRLEMKFGTNHETQSQLDVMTHLRRSGFKCATCWTAEDAIAVITDYMERKA